MLARIVTSTGDVSAQYEFALTSDTKGAAIVSNETYDTLYFGSGTANSALIFT